MTGQSITMVMAIVNLAFSAYLVHIGNYGVAVFNFGTFLFLLKFI